MYYNTHTHTHTHTHTTHTHTHYTTHTTLHTHTTHTHYTHYTTHTTLHTHTTHTHTHYTLHTSNIRIIVSTIKGKCKEDVVPYEHSLPEEDNNMSQFIQSSVAVLDMFRTVYRRNITINSSYSTSRCYVAVLHVELGGGGGGGEGER